MNILLDESLPKQLRPDLVGHTARTVGQMRWAGTKNGALLRLAEGQFDVILTADQHMQYQQNLRTVQIALLVLIVPDTRVQTLRLLVPRILSALETIQPGSIVEIRAAAP